MITVASATEHDRRERVLALAGVSSRTWTRVATYSNEVWLGDDIVVRINPTDERRLAREARIAARVPAAAKYPALIGSGSDEEAEWTITRRVPGISLGHAWPRMTPTQRERATHELAAALAALHATPIAGIEGDGPVHAPRGDVIAFDIHPPHTLPLARAIELLEDLRGRGGDRALLDSAEVILRDRWSAFDPRDVDSRDVGVVHGDVGLVHGDPHFENFLWDGEHVSALLDLEWARPSWIHVDLEILLSIAESPTESASVDREHEVELAHYADLPRWLAQAQPGWFTHPRLLERLEWLHISRALGHIDDSFEHPGAWARLRAALE
jgi:aminoglycoside phosphotransferase (APT) family kinase protein